MVDLADGGDWGRWHLSYWQMVLVFRCCFPLFNIKLTCNFLLLCFEISLHGILKPNGVSVYRCKMIEGDRCPHTVQLSLKHVIGRTNKFSALVWCHCWYLSAFFMTLVPVCTSLMSLFRKKNHQSACSWIDDFLVAGLFWPVFVQRE